MTEIQMTYGPKIEHLTAYDVETMPTVTLTKTGEKLPVLQIDGIDFTVTAVKDGYQVVIPFCECEGGQGCS